MFFVEGEEFMSTVETQMQILGKNAYKWRGAGEKYIRGILVSFSDVEEPQVWHSPEGAQFILPVSGGNGRYTVHVTETDDVLVRVHGKTFICSIVGGEPTVRKLAD